MRENDSTIILGVTVKIGDIVKIKFRSMEKVFQDNRAATRLASIVEYYDIDDHMTSFLQGGHFKVIGCADKDSNNVRKSESERWRSKNGVPTSDPKILSEITISDHVSDSNWIINEMTIESISVENEVAESYFSETHQLSLVLIDSVLFVNGHPLTNTDSKIYEMFEKVMADSAINRALSREEDDNLRF